MADYATLLRDHVTLTCRSVDRFFLQGMYRSCRRWERYAVLALAEADPDSFLGGVRQDRRGLRKGYPPLRPKEGGFRWCISRMVRAKG